MLNLKTLFENHFDTKNISDNNLNKFSQDHIQRIAINNGSGLFTDILNDTIAAHTNYFGAITSEATNFAVQQSRTVAVDNVIAAFKKEASRREGTIKNLFGKKGAGYQEFYPLGITEYSGATKANVEALIKRMVTAASAHASEVGSEFVTIFTTIKTNYESARNTQLGKIGEVSANKTTTQTKRDALEVQLTKNLHYIGFTFPGDIKRCMDFFDQSIIRRSGAQEEGTPLVTA